MSRVAVKGASRGFTLIEMMLAVGVLGLILVMLSGSFSTVAHSKVHAEDRLDTDHAGRALLFQMGNEIRGAIQTPQVASHVMLLGTGRMEGGQPLDSISISTLDYAHRRSLTGFGAEEVITYTAVPNPQRRGWYLLERSDQSGLIQYTGSNPNPLMLASNLISLHIRYFNGQLWSESWDSASFPRGQQLPIAISIELKMGGSNGAVIDVATEVAVPMGTAQW